MSWNNFFISSIVISFFGLIFQISQYTHLDWHKSDKLIKNAHKGIGIGTRFLGHVERCKILVHLIDAESDNLIESYQAIMKELDAYGNGLINKKHIIVITKMDLLENEKLKDKVEQIKQYTN